MMNKNRIVIMKKDEKSEKKYYDKDLNLTTLDNAMDLEDTTKIYLYRNKINLNRCIIEVFSDQCHSYTLTLERLIKDYLTRITSKSLGLKGKFIVIEGLDKSGKTTQLKLLKNKLDKENVNYLMTREPGGVKISEEIRKILLDKENDNMVNETECMLYIAARMQYIEDIVLPALKEGKIVISDRYMHSTIAYQGFGRGLGVDRVLQLHQYPFILLPDTSIILNTYDRNIESLLSRGRDTEDDRMDSQSIDFYKRVNRGYKKMDRWFPDINYIDCYENSIEGVYNQIESIFKNRGIL